LGECIVIQSRAYGKGDGAGDDAGESADDGDSNSNGTEGT